MKLMNQEEKVQKISALLTTEYIGRQLYIYDTVTSTFDEIDRLPKIDGTVVLAEKQTNGRGRLGRQWESQKGGLYFSVLLRPEITPENLQQITVRCAYAICKVLSEYTSCRIKWPNDIVSKSGKKLCGILTKLRFAQEKVDYVNVGIGINVNNESFSSELLYASSLKRLCGCQIGEDMLFCKVLAAIEECYNEKDFDKILTGYKDCCITLGSKVRATHQLSGEIVCGVCTDILSDAALQIKTDAGETIHLNSGEVSVRGIYGESYV